MNEVKESAEEETQTARGPPTEEANSSGKMSRENSRRAQRGRSIEMETMENNRFQRLRQFGDELPDVWYAYTGKYLYAYEYFGFMDYRILGKVPIQHLNLTHSMVKEIQSNAIRTTEGFNRRAKALRAKTRRYSGGNGTPQNRGAAVADAGLSGGGHRNTPGEGRDIQEGSGVDAVKPKLSMETPVEQPFYDIINLADTTIFRFPQV